MFYDIGRHNYFFCDHTSTVCHDVPGSNSKVIRSGDRYLKITTTFLCFTPIYDIMFGRFEEHAVSMKMRLADTEVEASFLPQMQKQYMFLSYIGTHLPEYTAS
jgi:hypothetical protein